MNKILFELKDVHFSYLKKFPALCNVSLNITASQMITIIGANGSGKSTLLHILDGLVFPEKGSIKAFGQELREDIFSDREFRCFFRSKVGLVFQNPDVQLFCPTVKEDILFGPLHLGFDRKQIEKNFDWVVDLLHLQNLLERSPHQLSIGEKRKVSIAGVLISSPEVLLLDEPTAGLDPLTSRQIIDIIIQSNNEGKTIITATHDLHLVEEISDLIYVFNKNKQIARYGSPDEILKDTEFLQIHNLIHTHSHKHEDKIHTHLHSHSKHHIE
ncbi:MAG: ABC transporter ATP-binding protein [Candidatus Firestonebacteria bacterium]